jgi:4-alpha-glucanotransferase
MQDLLGLDSGARMNRPGHGEGNWTWRVRQEAFNSHLAARLREQVILYQRLLPEARR